MAGSPFVAFVHDLLFWRNVFPEFLGIASNRGSTSTSASWHWPCHPPPCAWVLTDAYSLSFPTSMPAVSVVRTRVRTRVELRGPCHLRPGGAHPCLLEIQGFLILRKPTGLQGRRESRQGIGQVAAPLPGTSSSRTVWDSDGSSAEYLNHYPVQCHAPAHPRFPPNTSKSLKRKSAKKMDCLASFLLPTPNVIVM